MYPSGQHPLVNGSHAHQRYGMPMSKYQHPILPQHHHPPQHQQPQPSVQHHQLHQPQPQQAHHSHPALHAPVGVSAAAMAAHHQNFTPGVTLAGATPTSAHFASPTHIPAATTPTPLASDKPVAEEPVSEHWAQQLQLAAEARQSGSPHFHARTVAQQTKGIQYTSQTEAAIDGSAQDRNRAPAVKKRDEKWRGQNWTALDFGGQGLRALSPNLFHYTFLDKLFLNHNKLRSLPSAIGNLKHLTHLDLSNNEISELPPEIGTLTSLKSLLLFDNNISTLPFEMSYLYHLDVLGIEGNPLADSLKSIIVKDGSRALIKHLKETMPVPQPPKERPWLVLQEYNKLTPKPPGEFFTVLTYNTLCKNYATPYMYGYTPSEALSWEFRKNTLLHDITAHNADIICLQEVDKENFGTFYRPQLAAHGYKGVYWPRGRAHGMPEEEAKAVDGCATFFRDSVFILLDKHQIHFGNVAVARPDSKGQDDVYNRLWQRDNIAVVIFLENRYTGDRVIVANTHTFWDPEYNDVKVIQVAILMEELTRLADKWSKMGPLMEKSRFPVANSENGGGGGGGGGGANGSPQPPLEQRQSAEYRTGAEIPLILCGDFNSTPTSTVYDLIMNGRLAEEHPDLQDRMYGNLKRHGMRHPFHLKPAYDSRDKLAFTNYTPDYVEVIDYIWYSTNAFQVTEVLGNIDKEYLRRVPAFPNYHFPSDHIPLASEFRIKGKKTKVDVDFGPQRDRERFRERDRAKQ